MFSKRVFNKALVFSHVKDVMGQHYFNNKKSLVMWKQV